MKITEFVQDENGRASTPNAVLWLCVLVLSTQIIIDAINGNTNETVIGIFAGLVASVYGIKKGFDSSVKKASINSNVDDPK